MQLKLQSAAQLQELLHSGRALVAVDTETTGLSPKRDHVIEVGAVHFDAGGTKGEPFSTLVRCPVPLSPFITQLTGITDAMLSGALAADQLMPRFLEFVGEGDTVLVAHNARFDMGFLCATLERLGLPPLSNDFVDTLPVARALLPSLRKSGVDHPYGLQNLIRALGIDTARAHRAWDDAACCAKLLLHLATLSPDGASVNSCV